MWSDVWMAIIIGCSLYGIDWLVIKGWGSIFYHKSHTNKQGRNVVECTTVCYSVRWPEQYNVLSGKMNNDSERDNWDGK